MAARVWRAAPTPAPAPAPRIPQDKPVLNSMRLDTYYRIAEQLFLQFQSYLSMGDLQTA